MSQISRRARKTASANQSQRVSRKGRLRIIVASALLLLSLAGVMMARRIAINNVGFAMLAPQPVPDRKSVV